MDSLNTYKGNILVYVAKDFQAATSANLKIQEVS